MAIVEVSLLARVDLDQLIISRDLPDDSRIRVQSTLRILEAFPDAGKSLEGKWASHGALVGPWHWMIIVYSYYVDEDRAIVIAFHDARTSTAATD